jgi:hypothetical protein
MTFAGQRRLTAEAGLIDRFFSPRTRKADIARLHGGGIWRIMKSQLAAGPCDGDSIRPAWIILADPTPSWRSVHRE